MLTTRDNLREGAADLITLIRSLPNMNLDNDPAGDIDPAGIHYLGHSLGAIVGGVFLGVASQADVSTATLAMAGGGLPYLLRESPTIRARRIVGGPRGSRLDAGHDPVRAVLS